MDGKYEAKIGTTFATVEEGIAEIKRKIQKSRRIRISNIPMRLLEELKPLVKDKDIMIILPLNENPLEELKQLAPTATTKARIYVDYKGEEANSGSINFASTVFNIAWVKDKISVFQPWSTANTSSVLWARSRAAGDAQKKGRNRVTNVFLKP